jgi:NAD(P)H-flavin reductase
MSTALRNSPLAVEPDADPMVPRVARVAAIRQEIPDVATLDLVPDGDAAGLAPFVPGQFNMLTVFGVGESAISVSGDTADRNRLVHTIRAVGPVSAALTRLQPGDALGLRGPFGAGWPMAEADGQDVVVVAGGLGLAPLRPAIYHLLAHRERFGRIALLYGTRSPDQILFREELETWRRGLDIEVGVTVDHADSSWRGHVGVVTRLISRANFDPLSSIAFVCGPEVMMRFSIMALHEAEMPDAAIHLSMERNMKCAIGLCGHCQFGPAFICKDGPVFRHDKIRHLLQVKEL